MALHVPERFIVQHVLVEGAAHRVEEAQPALRPRRSEPAEAIVADRDAIAVAPLMARASVVDRDPGRPLKTRLQYLRRLADERFPVPGQQAPHLTLRDVEADRIEQGSDARDRALALVVEHQHEAMQLKVEAADHAVGQLSDDDAPIPASPTRSR